jgi:hypothetical protein
LRNKQLSSWRKPGERCGLLGLFGHGHGAGPCRAARAATPAATEAKGAQGDVALTIYKDLALVEDVRRIDLPKG